MYYKNQINNKQSQYSFELDKLDNKLQINLLQPKVYLYLHTFKLKNNESTSQSNFISKIYVSGVDICEKKCYTLRL